MVEIARFQYPEEAQTLVALLQAEGIDCYIRNEYSSRVMAGYVDIGGARVELLESSVPKALQLMKENGYEIPDDNEQPEQIKAISGLAGRIPFLRKLPLEKQIMCILVIIALLLVGLFYANQLLFTN